MSVSMPVKEPLAGHPILRSSHLDEVREVGARLFAPHHLALRERDARLDARLNAVQIGGVTLGWVRYGAGVRIVVEEMAGSYQVNIPLTGLMEISRADETIISTPAQPALLLPGQRYVGRWSADCEQVAVNFDRAALETELEQLLGRPAAAPIRFEFGMDLGDAAAQSWLAAVRLVVSECERPGSLVHHPQTVRHLEHLLATGLLLSQPHNYSSALLEPLPTIPGPRTVRRAIEIIESNLETPLTDRKSVV